jgi:hypothetical protein
MEDIFLVDKTIKIDDKDIGIHIVKEKINWYEAQDYLEKLGNTWRYPSLIEISNNREKLGKLLDLSYIMMNTLHHSDRILYLYIGSGQGSGVTSKVDYGHTVFFKEL